MRTKFKEDRKLISRMKQTLLQQQKELGVLNQKQLIYVELFDKIMELFKGNLGIVDDIKELSVRASKYLKNNKKGKKISL